MAVTSTQQSPSLDGITARNSTKVWIVLNGARVGRVQSFSHDQANNVQVLSELGREFTVELKKGIEVHSFSIAKFWTRNDVFATLKGGSVFSLVTRDTAGLNGDGTGSAEVLDAFDHCMIQTISSQLQAGQTTIAENASVVAIGSNQGQA